MPPRLPVPKGPLEQAIIFGSSTNPSLNNQYAMRGRGYTPSTAGTVSLINSGIPITQNQPGIISGSGGKKRLPTISAQVGVPAKNPFDSNFFTTPTPFDWDANSVNGQIPKAPVTWENAGNNQGPKSYDQMGGGMSNPFGVPSNIFTPSNVKQTTGINESREAPYMDPLTGQYVTNPTYGNFTKLLNPQEIAAAGETPSYTLDTVKFYDANFNNQDEAIKSWYQDQTKSYLLPDQGAFANMTQEQWDAINAEAPKGYEFTPWGWMSTNYLNSLIGGETVDEVYDYGGSTWGGGGGGGTRQAMDQFYFGLMNWGI